MEIAKLFLSGFLAEALIHTCAAVVGCEDSDVLKCMEPCKDLFDFLSTNDRDRFLREWKTDCR